MPDPHRRPTAQRVSDTVAKLAARPVDAWVASSGDDGPHLVPLTLAWTGTEILLAVEASSRTARNIVTTRRSRIGLGPTRDVVVIDAELIRASSTTEAPDLAERYAAQSDWDPRGASPPMLLLVLRPTRIQAWRESNEIAGRTVMRNGAWLV